MSASNVRLLTRYELPEGAREDMQRAQEDFELLAKVADNLSERHPGWWVGVHHGQIIGPEKTWEALLETLEARNIPVGRTINYRLTPKDEIWILPAL